MAVTVPDRILVVGSGSIAQRHVRNLLDLGVLEVIVSTRRDVDADGIFRRDGVSIVREIPDDCPELAIVANDTNRHVETARQLVALGANVLIEKPLAPSLGEDVLLLDREARSGGVCVRIGYNMRFLGALLEVRSILESGMLGRLLFARVQAGQWLPDWRPSRLHTESYSASAERGGGVELDLSHEVDYMRMLFGQPSEWVARRTATGALGIETTDVFDAIYTYRDGPMCALHLDYLARPARRGLRIVGLEGELECDLAGRRLVVDAGGTRIESGEPALFDTAATYVQELREFFSVATSGPSDGDRLATVHDAMAVLRLLNDGHERTPDD